MRLMLVTTVFARTRSRSGVVSSRLGGLRAKGSQQVRSGQVVGKDEGQLATDPYMCDLRITWLLVDCLPDAEVTVSRHPAEEISAKFQLLFVFGLIQSPSPSME